MPECHPSRKPCSQPNKTLHCVFGDRNEGTMCWGDKHSQGRIQPQVRQGWFGEQPWHSNWVQSQSPSFMSEKGAYPNCNTYYHYCAPCNNNGREEYTRSDFSDHNHCWSLEDSIRDEENKGDNGVGIILSIHPKLRLHSRRKLAWSENLRYDSYTLQQKLHRDLSYPTNWYSKDIQEWKPDVDRFCV